MCVHTESGTTTFAFSGTPVSHVLRLPFLMMRPIINLPWRNERRKSFVVQGARMTLKGLLNEIVPNVKTEIE